MDAKGILNSPIYSSLTPVFFALSIATGILLQFGGASFDEAVNYPLLLIAVLTLSLGMTLLPLRLTKPLGPTSTRLINYLATATLTATLTTLVLALSEASTVFTNSRIFSHWGAPWALQWGSILLAIAVVYKSINEILISRTQQYQVVFFILCVAFAGLYTEPLGSMGSTIPYNSVIYETYCIYHFALVPCTFVLGALLLILGVVIPDHNSPCPFPSLIFKEVFAKLTLSMGCIALLIGASLAVCLSTINSALVGGAGAVMEVGAI